MDVDFVAEQWNPNSPQTRALCDAFIADAVATASAGAATAASSAQAQEAQPIYSSSGVRLPLGLWPIVARGPQSPLNVVTHGVAVNQRSNLVGEEFEDLIHSDYQWVRFLWGEGPGDRRPTIQEMSNGFDNWLEFGVIDPPDGLGRPVFIPEEDNDDSSFE